MEAGIMGQLDTRINILMLREEIGGVGKGSCLPVFVWLIYVVMLTADLGNYCTS